MPPKKRVAARNYKSYMGKLLKRRNAGGIGLRSQAVVILNDLIENLENRINVEAVKYAKLEKKSTLSSSHIQCATRVVLSGTLGSHAVSQGTDAVKRHREL